MFVAFDELPGDSRIWIYQGDRNFNDHECREIMEKGEAFVDAWTAHNKTLKASIQIFYHRFLILGVDQSLNEASGCSIDSSVKFFKDLENYLSKQYGPITFFDRTRIAFLKHDDIESIHFKNIKDEIAKGTIAADTFTFDNLVNQKRQLDDQWLVPAGDSWLAKYFQGDLNQRANPAFRQT